MSKKRGGGASGKVVHELPHVKARRSIRPKTVIREVDVKIHPFQDLAIRFPVHARVLGDGKFKTRGWERGKTPQREVKIIIKPIESAMVCNTT